MPPRQRFVRYEIAREPARALHMVTAINIGVFVAWHIAIAMGPGAQAFMEANFLVSGDALLHGRLWTLLTSEFSHVALWHLGFNVLALNVFGRDLEAVLGARGFWHLYLAGAVSASAAHGLYDMFTPGDIPALGASGAAMAIAVVFALMFPNRLLLLFFVIPMPAIAAVGLFVLIDLMGLLSPGADQIAHAAHLGGAAYGAFYHRTWVGPYLHEHLARVGFRRVERGGGPPG